MCLSGLHPRLSVVRDRHSIIGSAPYVTYCKARCSRAHCLKVRTRLLLRSLLETERMLLQWDFTSNRFDQEARWGRRAQCAFDIWKMLRRSCDSSLSLSYFAMVFIAPTNQVIRHSELCKRLSFCDRFIRKFGSSLDVLHRYGNWVNLVYHTNGGCTHR